MLVAFQLPGTPEAPLKLTVLVPCVAPKFVPVIVTNVATAPEAGERLVILGGASTVKLMPLLVWVPTCTTTLPVVAPLGTGATMLVLVQLAGVAVVPLNLTVLIPFVDPKFVPAIVTGVPTSPDVGDRLVIAGAVGVTVKLIVLLSWPPTVTTTFPVVAPTGTEATIFVALQLVGAAVVPLKVIVLAPCDAPKLNPAIVIGVPTAPEAGDRFVMVAVVPAAPLEDLKAAMSAIQSSPDRAMVQLPAIEPAEV